MSWTPPDVLQGWTGMYMLMIPLVKFSTFWDKGGTNPHITYPPLVLMMSSTWIIHINSWIYWSSWMYLWYSPTFTNLGSYGHLYIHVIYLFIQYIFYSHIISPVLLHVYRDWSISYLASYLNLPSYIYYLVHNTYITHRLSLKKNGLTFRNIGFTKYFITSICCVVILICSFLTPQYTHDIPRCSHGISRRSHDIPQYAEHPPVYLRYRSHKSWYPLDVLKMPPNIPRCTEHTGHEWCFLQLCQKNKHFLIWGGNIIAWKSTIGLI